MWLLPLLAQEGPASGWSASPQAQWSAIGLAVLVIGGLSRAVWVLYRDNKQLSGELVNLAKETLPALTESTLTLRQVKRDLDRAHDRDRT